MTVVWDGDGVDPWLPQRLRNIAEVTAAERFIYDDWFARLAAWLVGVNRAVTGGSVPNPDALWSQVPAWAASMAEFVGSTVTSVMGAVYERVLGPGFMFDARPAVAAHLAQVHNRMMRTPNNVYDDIARAVTQAALAGESIPDTAKRIDELLNVHQNPNWSNRSTVVARTETIGAMNAGRVDSFAAVADELDDEFEQVWLATADERTRPSHRNADGQRVPLEEPFNVGGSMLRFPGDPNGPAAEVIQCRCSVLLMRPGENLDLSNRQFSEW